LIRRPAREPGRAILTQDLHYLGELLVTLAVILLATRFVFGYVAHLAAWIDSGFRSSPGPVTTGSEGMLRRRGVARTPLDPAGKVRVGSELWNAVASEPVAEGDEVAILGVDGLTLQVAPRASDPGRNGEASRTSLDVR